MEKLLRGVIKYRQTVRNDLVQQFKDVSNRPQVGIVFPQLSGASADRRLLHLYGFSDVADPFYSVSSR